MKNLMKRITTILAISLLLFTQEAWSQDCDSIFIVPSIEVTSDINPTIVENPLGNITYYDICIDDTIHFLGNWRYLNELEPQHPVDSMFNWEHKIDGAVSFENEKSYSPIFKQRGLHEISLNITDSLGCINKSIEKTYVRVSHVEPDEAFITPSIVCIDTEKEIEVAIRPDISVIPMNLENKFSNQKIIPTDTDCEPDSIYKESITVNSFLPGQSLTDVSKIDRVCINMEHSYGGHLIMELSGPNGANVILLSDENGTGEGKGGNGLGLFSKIGTPNSNDNINCEAALNPPGEGSLYCWSPNPTVGTWHDLKANGSLGNPIISSDIDPNNYRTYAAYNDSFNELNGTKLNGEWNLTIKDIDKGGNGYVFEWWIEFNESITPSNLTFKPQASSYEWLYNDSLISRTNTTLFKSTVPGNFEYDIDILDSFGCSYQVADDVMVPTRIELISEISIPDSCENRIGKIAVEVAGGTKPYEYFWNTIGKTDSTVSYLRSGTYPYVITDATNCTFEDEVVVEDRSKQVEALFSHELDTCTSELNLINESTNLLYSVWNYEAPKPSFENDLVLPNLGGIYNIELIGSNEHCADTISSTIDLTGTDAYSRVKFPNVFTPNEDGINDLLSIYGLRDCETGSLKIYNKWGDEVYYSIFPGRYLWDGKRFDEELSEGTYFYVLKLNHAEFKGAFSLFR